MVLAAKFRTGMLSGHTNVDLQGDCVKRLFIIFSLLLASPIALAVEDVLPREAAHLATEGMADLIDVREREELEKTGMAAHALWLATSEVEAASSIYEEFVAELDPTKILIFYCRSGRRAGIVAKHFEELGFTTMNMGGFEDWLNADLPIKDFVP